MSKLLIFLIAVALIVLFAYALISATVADAQELEPDCPWPHRLFKVFVANVSQCKGVNCFYGSWDNP